MRNRFYGAVLAIDCAPSHIPRLGITAPKTYGNAVSRNLFKRRVRAIFQKEMNAFSDLAIVVLPKKGQTALSFEAIRNDLLEFAHVSQHTTTASR